MSIFDKVAFKKPSSNRFVMNHDVKMSFQMGEITPTLCMEVLPGDIININPATLLRFAPLISPIMHRVKVQTHFFFVPNRILWDDWEAFITRKDTDLLAPTYSAPETIQGSIADYLGVPTGVYDADVQISALPLAAYARIWDEYYRDQNLQAERFAPLAPGNANPAYATYAEQSPWLRAWNRDYFTSALPSPQDGGSVAVPLTFQDDIPVNYGFRSGGQNQNTGYWRRAADGTVIADSTEVKNGPGPTPLAGGTIIDGEFVAYDPNGTLNVDIQSEATDINTLRYAFRLQEYLERAARGGKRYVEQLLVTWGVKSADSRLQRPEFIGSTSGTMTISEVLATADNPDTVTPVGQMAGHGISASGGNNFSYRAQEHGWIIGLISVMPITAYQQGLHRQFTRQTALDFADPIFAHLGEQAILNREVYLTGDAGSDISEFGYTPRFSEYKYLPSRVAADMRTQLSFWHLGRIFANPPQLNEEFISCRPEDQTRIFAVESTESDNIYCHIINNVTAVRKLPRYGIPSI